MKIGCRNARPHPSFSLRRSCASGKNSISLAKKLLRLTDRDESRSSGCIRVISSFLSSARCECIHIYTGPCLSLYGAFNLAEWILREFLYLCVCVCSFGCRSKFSSARVVAMRNFAEVRGWRGERVWFMKWESMMWLNVYDFWESFVPIARSCEKFI